MACAPTAKKRSFGETFDDNVMAIRLRTKFLKDKVVPSQDISIKVRRGVVTLTGEVNRQEQLNRSIELAEMQPGVKEVKAYLVLREFGKLKQHAEKKSIFKTLFSKKRLNDSHPSQDPLKETDLLDQEQVREE